jgi:hypothetical protein
MPTSITGMIALYTYLVGFWSYLFLASIATWPRLPIMAWLKYVLIKAGQATFWPVLVAVDSFGFAASRMSAVW